MALPQNNVINQYYDTFIEMQLQALKPGAQQTVTSQKIMFLSKHKKTIIKQALFNLGFKKTQNLTNAQLEQFKQELNSILFNFDTVPSFFKKGDELEHPTTLSTPEEIQKITARNYLRLFLRGSQVGKQNDWVWNSPLFTKELFNAISHQGPHDLLKEVRVEIQNYLDTVYTTMCQGTFSKAQSSLVQKHLFPLLASLVFFDNPNNPSTIYIPVNINNTWHRVQYSIQKLDISPKPTDSGLDGAIARKLKDEDRFQMLGLTPSEPNIINAKPILLLNGTPPPGSAGSDLAVIHNFGIRKSVGETHNWDAINAWIKSRKDIIVYGHSKGGSMAQIVAAEHPDNIYSVDALCAPALHNTTLKRLRTTRYGKDNLSWDERYQAKIDGKKIHIPHIKIYHQPGDPVFHFEKGFLPGTEIRHVITDKESAILNAYPIPTFFSRMLEGHSFSSLGYNLVGYLKGNWEQENKRELRAFLDTAKDLKNYFTTFGTKLNTYFNKVLNCKSLPKLIELPIRLTLTIINNLYGIFAISMMAVLLIPSGIKNGSKYLYNNPESIKDFVKYLFSLKFLSDIKTGLLKGIAFFPKLAYIGLNVLCRLAKKNPWYTPKSNININNNIIPEQPALNINKLNTSLVQQQAVQYHKKPKCPFNNIFKTNLFLIKYHKIIKKLENSENQKKSKLIHFKLTS